MGVDAQGDQLGAIEAVGVGPEGDPPGGVDVAEGVAFPGGVGVQVVVCEGRDDLGVPELPFGQLHLVVASRMPSVVRRYSRANGRFWASRAGSR